MGNAASTHAGRKPQPSGTTTAGSDGAPAGDQAKIHADLAHALQQQQTVVPTHQQHTNNSSSDSVALTIHSRDAALAPHKKPRTPCACAHLHDGKTCLSYLVSSFGRSFYLAYGIRSGITLALHVIKLLRSKNPMAVFDLNELVSAHGLPIDAVRVGLFVGCFTGLYNGMRCLLARTLGRDDRYTVLGAGTVAGLSLLFQPADTHRTLALYAWARVAQCWYNKQKASGRWHLWGSDWKHGDSLLFSVCSAQVMYAYVMRPETLPPPYFQFIVSTGPIQLPVLDAVKANHRGQAINMQALKDVYEKFAPKATVAAAPLEIILKTLSENAYGKGASPLYPPLLPCSIMHPQNPHCSSQWLETFLNGAKRSLPIYLSLTFVPMFILRFWAVIKHPVEQLQRGLWSVTRSTSFLSSFVATYMMIVCWQRKLVVRDHRSLYWVAGFIASWTILLEQKSRRSELALYVLPRTIDSLVQTMQSRQMLAEVPHGEKMLFMTGMGALMYFRTFHPETMSPFLKRVLNFLVPSSASMPKDAGATASTVAAHHEKHLTSAPSSSASTTEPRMQRKDSDGLSAASINGTIPLPSAGISFAREQSFPSQPLAALVAGGASSSSLHMIRGSPPPHSSSSSDASITSGLVARDLSPTGEELAVPSLSSTPEVSLFSPTSRSDLAPSLSSSPDQEQEETARSARGGSCVGEKVDSIETRINSERPESGGLQEELAQELNKQQQQQQQHSSNGNGKKKKRSNH